MDLFSRFPESNTQGRFLPKINEDNIDTNDTDINEAEKFNNIKCNFYLPINKKAKLMFCGEGNNIKVSELEIKSFFKYDDDKEKIGLILSDERKACDCCSIF